MTTSKSRHFGGKLKNFTDKQERAFEQKHLKVYLAGNTKFCFGFRDILTYPFRERVWHDVKAVWS